MKNFPSDYVRRSELQQVLNQLDRTLKIIETMQERHNELVALYDALCDELDRSYAGIDQDFSSLARGLMEVAEQAGVQCSLNFLDPDERDAVAGEGVAEPEDDGEVVYTSADKKLLH